MWLKIFLELKLWDKCIVIVKQYYLRFKYYLIEIFILFY